MAVHMRMKVLTSNNLHLQGLDTASLAVQRDSLSDVSGPIAA